MQIIDGRKIKESILEDLKNKVDALPFSPLFCDILVGDDSVSASYVRIKSKAAESIGIKFRTINFPAEISTSEIIEEINNLNRVPHICGVIVQLPIPPHIDTQMVLDSIDPMLDVDCLGSFNSTNFYNDKESSIGYPTALACMYILDSLNLDLYTKKIVVLGQGKLVGLPVSHLLEHRGLNISRINSKTENREELLRSADVIISAMGKGKYLNGSMIKEGVVIIDAGTSEDNGGIVGDVDIESVQGIASFVSPCPGGVGPVTVAMLLQNIVEVARLKSLKNLEPNE